MEGTSTHNGDTGRCGAPGTTCDTDMYMTSQSTANEFAQINESRASRRRQHVHRNLRGRENSNIWRQFCVQNCGNLCATASVQQCKDRYVVGTDSGCNNHEKRIATIHYRRY